MTIGPMDSMDSIDSIDSMKLGPGHLKESPHRSKSAGLAGHSARPGLLPAQGQVMSGDTGFPPNARIIRFHHQNRASFIADRM